jgi:hypothetical protein
VRPLLPTWYAFFVAMAAPALAAPQEGLALAWEDAKKLDKATAYYTRYLDLTHAEAMYGPGGYASYAKDDTVLLNYLSTSPNLYTPRTLTVKGKDAQGKEVDVPQMLAVDLRRLCSYKDKDRPLYLYKLWERLVDREFFYHQFDGYQDVEDWDVDQFGRRVPTQARGRRNVRKMRPADHLNKAQLAELYAATASQVPVVCGDWFFWLASVSADRGNEKDGKFVGGGYGYYDFLGLKNRADYFRVIGFDPNNLKSEESLLLAVVDKTDGGVAQNHRMIAREDAVGRPAWRTLDFLDNNLGNRNPLKILNPYRGLDHQAEEHFGTLSNGLAVTIACDAKGNLQTTAPDKIGPDKSARWDGNKDYRIHTTRSCFSCHSNGFLQDIPDKVRATYRFDPKGGYNALASADEYEREFLQAAYLRDLNVKVRRDREEYELALAPLLPPLKDKPSSTQVAEVFNEGYFRYELARMSPAMVAAGLGVTPEVFAERFRAYRLNDKLSSHPINVLSTGGAMARVDYEEHYALLMQITRGVSVP